MLYSDNNETVRNKPNYKYLNSIYAHGELESILGFDIVGTDDMIEYNSIFKNFKDKVKTIDLKITDDNGNIHDVKGYLWMANNKRILGLIVLESDIKSVEYAKKKQEIRQGYI